MISSKVSERTPTASVLDLVRLQPDEFAISLDGNRIAGALVHEKRLPHCAVVSLIDLFAVTIKETLFRFYLFISFHSSRSKMVSPFFRVYRAISAAGVVPALKKRHESATGRYSSKKFFAPRSNRRRIVSSGIECPPSLTLAATRAIANSTSRSQRKTTLTR